MRLHLVVALITVAGAVQAQHQPYALNRYPGPMHVLELADRLNLSAEQRQATKRLMDAHKAEARVLGARLVDAEGRLDALFRRGQVQSQELAAAVREAATLQGEYRLAHLETHHRLRAILTEAQVAQYDILRGYASPSGRSGHKHGG
jgi:Spy/CpxP family protein refolding chaperone